MKQQSKLSLLAVAVSTVLAGAANAGHEIVDAGKQQVHYQEPSRFVSGSVSAGYWSKFIFRGTNLTPNSEGLIWAQGTVSLHPWENGTFTFGLWAGSQLGKARVEGAERIGESGGGAVTGGNFGGASVNTTAVAQAQGGNATAAEQEAIIEAFNNIFSGERPIQGDDIIDFVLAEFNALGAGLNRDDVIDIFQRASAEGFIDLPPQQITRYKTTNVATQDRFTEIDAYVEYRHDFGPIEVAVGNIFFYIDRESTSVFTLREFYASEDAREFVKTLSGLFANSGSTSVPALPITRGDERDLLINRGKKVTLRRNSTGDEWFDRVYAEVSTNAWMPYIKPRVVYYHTVVNGGDSGDPGLLTDRYDAKGGYLEFKVDGSIPLYKAGSIGVTDYKTGVTTGGDERIVLSLDPHARVSYSFRDRTNRDGSSLTGWNHLQLGVELSWNVTETFRVVPELNYMYHISDPTLGTERNTWWGGAKVEVVF